ncbi:MAG: response regulator [bacterium]|nr:response regulator [bacterium]
MNDEPGRQSVLVVDDDELVRDMLFQVLSDNGYHVELASSGEEALGLLGQRDVQVCLSDIIMPDCDGLELIPQIRRKFPDIHIIAISGGGRIGPESYLATARRLGASKVLCKPFDGAILLAEIRDLLGQAVTE